MSNDPQPHHTPDAGTTDDHDDCPPEHHRCHIKLHGYMDCPHPHMHMPERVIKTLKVPCGAQSPDVQLMAYVNNPINVHPIVIQVLDLGHDGWTIIFVQDA